MDHHGEFRLCLYLDVSGYGRRTTATQMRIQSWLVEIVERALRRSGIRKKRSVRQEQGDGCLLLVDPRANLPRSVFDLLSGLTESAAWINEPLAEDYRFQVRVALDAGVVRNGDNGFVGRTVTRAARLVDADPLRRALQPSRSSVGFIVSDPLYRDVIEDDVSSRPALPFTQEVIDVKEYAGWGWLHVPEATRVAAGDTAARAGAAAGLPRS